MSLLIDGKAFASQLRSEIAGEVASLKSSRGITPGLAVVLVGEDPASQVYVRNKAKQTVEVGMNSFEHKLPASTSESDLLALIEKLNQDVAVHGILVQLPLPKQINAERVLDAISPRKDADGFHVINAGRLATGTHKNSPVPCTPLGCLLLLRDAAAKLNTKLAGKHAVVIGRSNIVGKPMAHLLLGEDCTVTIAHSRTADLPALCRNADILVAAVGKPHMVKADWVKQGAMVIDVGINRITAPDGSTKLVGDVDFDAVSPKAAAITPVPGGVGPMTIACLLKNTLELARN